MYDRSVAVELSRNVSCTRGNKYKLQNHSFHYSFRKFYFAARVVNVWNSLPDPYLGVVISSDLRWRHHIDSICAKATRTLNFLKRNCYRCPAEAKALAYVSLRPHLEFASAAWDPFTGRDIKGLEMVQRRSARFVKKDYRSTTSVTGCDTSCRPVILSIRAVTHSPD